MRLERNYQPKVISKLEAMFPGCYVLKNDAEYMQGVPDLIILYNDRWAMLETKKAEGSRHQPNQDYYVEDLDRMSFAAFIHPDNEEEVLSALQSALSPRRTARVSKR